MLIVTLSLVLTALLLAKKGYSGRMHTLDLGAMSHQWIAAHNASQHSSSM